MTRKPPFHDPALDPPKPKPTDHVFQGAWYHEPHCTRCHRAQSEIEGKNIPCWTDEQIKAGQVFARMQRQRTA